MRRLRTRPRSRQGLGSGERIVALILVLIVIGGLALIAEGIWLKATSGDDVAGHETAATMSVGSSV